MLITEQMLAEQEDIFARAFASADKIRAAVILALFQ